MEDRNDMEEMHGMFTSMNAATSKSSTSALLSLRTLRGQLDRSTETKTIMKNKK